MPLPSLTYTGNLKDVPGSVTGGELTTEAMSQARITLTSNIPSESYVKWQGGIYRINPVRARVDSDGNIVNEDGGPVLLLANDDGLNVRRVQWRFRCEIPTQVIPPSLAGNLRSFWFDATGDGTTIEMRDVVPVLRQDVFGTPVGDGLSQSQIVALVNSNGTALREALDALYEGGGGGGGPITADQITDATTIGKALVRAASQAAARSAISAVSASEVTTQVNSAVSSLVAGAPGALDNFAELAAALGNNPNLATDITAALAGLSAEISTVDATIRSDMTAALGGKLDKPVGFPNGTKIIAGDGTLIDIPSGGGGGGSPITNDAVIGDGTIGPFTVTHNRGTRNVDAVFYETVGANTGREVDILWRRISKDAIRIEPSIPIAIDGIHVHLEARPTDDAIAPATPTVVLNSKTSTTATFTASSTDSVGVVAYNWFKNGSYITTVYGSGAYTFTGLTPGTLHASGTFTAVAFDRAGNESAAGAYGSNLTTDASPVVSRNSTGQGRSTGSTTVSWSITIVPGANISLEAFVLDSHASWFAGSTIDVHTLVSNLDGPLTEVSAIDTGPGGQDQGTLRTYVLGSLAAPTRPTVGTHTLTATVTEGGYTPASMCGLAVAHNNVASIANIVTNRSTGQNAVNQTLLSNTGDFNLQAVSYDAAAPTAGNRTQVGSTVGGSVGGMGDFLFVQEAPGVVTSQAFTTTGNQWHAEVGMQLVKAA